MRHTLLITVATLATATMASAQDLPQAGNAWFQAGEATIADIIARQPITSRAKNVILFTADGNGVGTNYAIRLFSGQQAGGMGDDYVQPQETFPNLALVKTYSTNGQTPDSAPTASAMNTGVKLKNTMINVDDSVAVDDCGARTGHELTTFAEMMSAEGKSVGTISTARITHATPAAVYAKSVNRNWEDNTGIPEGCDQLDIADQLLEQMKNGVIDLAMGGGRAHFLPESVTDDEGKTGKRTDDRNLVEEAAAAGAQYAWNEEGFTGLALDGSAPILALFESSHMKYDYDRTDEPSLAEMTGAAITALSTNADGYYLNVEAGRVDHANHDGNLFRVLHDGKAFADAIQVAMDNTDPAETLIIVTADHEHAIAFNGYCGRGSDVLGLCYVEDETGTMHSDELNMGADGKPYTVVGYLNGPGAVMIEQPDGTYSGTRAELTQEEAMDPDYLQPALVPMDSETHSGEDVTVMARGPWAHLFAGVIEQNVIFHVMNHAVHAE